MSLVQGPREEAEENYTQARVIIEEALELLSHSGSADPVLQASVLAKYAPWDRSESTYLMAVAITMIHQGRTMEGP